MADSAEVEVSLRQFVVDLLTPLVPTGWTFYPGYVAPGVLDSPTAWITLKSIGRHPAAPQGLRLATYTITLATPITTVLDRDDSIDDAVTDLLWALDQTADLTWTTAERGVTSDGNLGYDIEVTTPFQTPSNPNTESES